MNFSKRNKSIVDLMFIIALFGAFAITGLFVVLFGANVYKTTVNSMDVNYASRTSLSYITEKIRSHDCVLEDGREAIEIKDIDGKTVLLLRECVNDRIYVTYIFESDGYLKEYTSLEEYDFNYDAGTEIIKASLFRIEKIKKALYHVEIVDEYENSTSFYVALYNSDDD